jgi:UDP-N-acetylmuramate dehydrogenase
VEHAARLLGALVHRQAPLGALTTYRVGGPAALAVQPRDEDELRAVADAVRASGVPVLVVGRGSNLLVSDAGFPGLAVMVGEAFAEIDIAGTVVRAGGGASLPVVARKSAAAGLTGFEWAVGVPGSVGGAVRMNAGGHGSDLAATLRRARIVDLTGGGPAWRAGPDLAFGYRRSALRTTDVVVAAELGLESGDQEAAEALIGDIVRWRRANQPGGQNAGSVFTNPPGDSAGRLVDAAGLKGLRHGSAQVSPKHANFIQADEGGSAEDVRALMEAVRARVREATGVELQTEIRLIGFPDTYPRGMVPEDVHGA